jgi:hypothetical protein
MTKFTGLPSGVSGAWTRNVTSWRGSGVAVGKGVAVAWAVAVGDGVSPGRSVAVGDGVSPGSNVAVGVAVHPLLQAAAASMAMDIRRRREASRFTCC